MKEKDIEVSVNGLPDFTLIPREILNAFITAMIEDFSEDPDKAGNRQEQTFK